MQALASSQGRDAFLCQAAAACDALDDDGGGGGSGRPSEARRKQGQALLKLAQGCLQQLSSTTSTSSNAEGGGSACRVEGEAQLALYQAASKAAHAVASRAAEVLPPPSTSSSSSSPSSMAGGLERILYHVIARGMEVKQVRDAAHGLIQLSVSISRYASSTFISSWFYVHFIHPSQYRDVQDLTRALAARVSALLEARPPPPAAARRAGDDEDDWGAEAAAAAASSGRQKKVAAASDGASSGKGRRPPRGGGGEGGEGSGSGGFGFPAPPAGCFDATLAKLVCSAAVNGARAIAEEAAVASPGDAKDWATRLEAAAVECLPWVQTLRASSNSSDATAAKEAGERLFRALWKGATALDQREEWDGALRLRRVACTLKCVGVAQVVGQLWRAGAAYEKAAASLSSYSSRALLEGVVALYEAAGEEAVFVDARAEQQQQLLLLHWAVACVEALDWLRHHGSLCARLQQPARASALVQRALASCEMGKGAKKEKTEEDPRLSLARVALRLQLATASLAAGLGGTGGSSGSDRNTGSSGRKGKAGYQEEEQGRAVLEEALTALDAVQHSVPGGQQQPKSLLEQPQPHVVRVWRALARLPTVLPSSALTTTSTSDTAGASCCSPATVEAAARGCVHSLSIDPSV